MIGFRQVIPETGTVSLRFILSKAIQKVKQRIASVLLGCEINDLINAMTSKENKNE